MNCSCLTTNEDTQVETGGEGAGVKVKDGLGVGVTRGGLGDGVRVGIGVGDPPKISGGLSAIIGIQHHPVTGLSSASISALVHVPCISKQTV